MKPLSINLLFVACCFVLNGKQLAHSQNGTTLKRSEIIKVDLKQFKEPSNEAKREVEQWLLDLELIPMLANRIAFTATGTYFFSGTANGKKIANLRQFGIGWGLDNQQDRERLLVINQRLLNPRVIDQDLRQMMQSDTSALDRLRIKSEFHEANGAQVYPPSRKTRLQKSLEISNAFFPTQAATTTPVSCWAGHALNRSKPIATIQKMKGIQQVGQHTVAIFEYRPADYYRFFVSLAFLDGSPVQCDAWRQLTPSSNHQPPPQNAWQEASLNHENHPNKYLELNSSAIHVARTRSEWKKLGHNRVPIWIHGTTLNEMYDVELSAEINWYVNHQVNERVFAIDSLRQMGPFSFARENQNAASKLKDTPTGRLSEKQEDISPK